MNISKMIVGLVASAFIGSAVAQSSGDATSDVEQVAGGSTELKTRDNNQATRRNYQGIKENHEQTKEDIKSIKGDIKSIKGDRKSTMEDKGGNRDNRQEARGPGGSVSKSNELKYNANEAD